MSQEAKVVEALKNFNCTANDMLLTVQFETLGDYYTSRELCMRLNVFGMRDIFSCGRE